MKDKVALFWFRRDLRLQDNVGLYLALQGTEKVLPIFIFDSDILQQLKKNDARVSFIHENLQKMDKELKKIKSSLLVKHGNPLNVLKNIAEDFTISSVYTNHDYEPYATNRDVEVERFLTSIGANFHSFKDQVIFEKNEIVKPNNQPYTIYTPYAKKWISTISNEKISFYDCSVNSGNFLQINSDFPSLESIGFEKSVKKVKPYNLSEEGMIQYEAKRNFPAIENSNLSTHLRFGTVSVRKCVSEALKIENQTFLKELIWREFFMQILWHFPKSVTDSFKAKYDGIEWRNNEAEFKAWCEGKTGYPLVDAGMRELNETGYMHNRVRMVTASFLCKHLLVDWRWGEAYFAEKLMDFDLAQNVGNWQWVAGTGCDAAPYFRIFNPSEQIKKFDKDFIYIKKWVPEFQELTYTMPIVEHRFARERCLEVYKQGLQKF